MKKILVPLDGSELAARAVPFAATIAAKARQPLLLLRAVPTLSAASEAEGAAQTREAQQDLDVVAVALTADGVTAETQVVDEEPDTAILTAAADDEVDLVVMSTHGRGGLGRWIYGSVADTVLRNAPVPVLIVPPHGLDRWPADAGVKILVPLDGSDVARTALGPACELADVLGGSLHLLTVVSYPTYATYPETVSFVAADLNDELVREMRQELDELAAELRMDTRPVETSAIFGSPYFSITATAHDLGAGLIAMATHGRGGVARALLGSVATATVRQSEVPVVLVRPGEADLTLEGAPEDEAAPAQTTQRVEQEPTIPLALTGEQLDLLVKVVGDRFHNQPVDPAAAAPLGRVLEKLRTARATASRRASRSGEAPAP